MKLEDDNSTKLEEDDDVPRPLRRGFNPDTIEIAPNDKQLFIKTITPDVSRQELEAVSWRRAELSVD
jgi:hypothetical protein